VAGEGVMRGPNGPADRRAWTAPTSRVPSSSVGGGGSGAAPQALTSCCCRGEKRWLREPPAAPTKYRPSASIHRFGASVKKQTSGISLLPFDLHTERNAGRSWRAVRGGRPAAHPPVPLGSRVGTLGQPWPSCCCCCWSWQGKEQQLLGELAPHVPARLRGCPAQPLARGRVRLPAGLPSHHECRCRCRRGDGGQRQLLMERRRRRRSAGARDPVRSALAARAV
jgi:hypothetical protein